MKFKSFLIVFCIALFTLHSTSCGSKTSKKVVTETPREGRDKELYADGLKSLRKHRYEEGRVLLNTLISTYDDSVLLPLSKLLIADSFYKEGGTSNLAQAEVEYREWLQFFPHHQLADDVMLKIAELHVRQVDVANRDWSQALAAEHELVRLQKEYPQSDLNQQVNEYLVFVHEQLAMHELGIARYYFKHRHAWNGVQSRSLAIVKKYPEFTHMDEALFLLGSALVEKENTPEAATYFARIVREYPNSEYRDKAAEMLERFGVQVPEPDPNAQEKIVTRKGFIKAKLEELFGTSIKVSRDGVILKNDNEIDQTAAETLNESKSNTVTPDSSITSNKEKKEEEPEKKNNPEQPANVPTVKVEKNPKNSPKKKGFFGKMKIFGRG